MIVYSCVVVSVFVCWFVLVCSCVCVLFGCVSAFVIVCARAWLCGFLVC